MIRDLPTASPNRLSFLGSRRLKPAATRDAKEVHLGLKSRIALPLCGLLFTLLFLVGSMQAGIRITPRLIFKHLTQEDMSFSVQITHIGGEGEGLKIRVIPTGLKVGLLGEPQPKGSEKEKEEASRIFQIEPQEFSLPPGASKVVKVQVNPPPGKEGGIYKMIIFQVENLKIQIGGLKPDIVHIPLPVLLTLPGPSKVEGKIIGIEIKQREPLEAILIETKFLNTGNIHFSPSGRILTKKESGEEIAQIPIPSHTAFPGYTRVFPAFWKAPDLAAGKYETKVIMKIRKDFTVTCSERFIILSDGRLAQSKGEILKFTLAQVQEKEPVVFDYSFKNGGNVSLTPKGTVQILDAQGKLIAKLKAKPEEVPPKRDASFRVVYKSGLPQGEYKAHLKVEYGEKDYGGAEETGKEISFFISGEKMEDKVRITKFLIKWLKKNQLLEGTLTVENLSEGEIDIEGFINLKNREGKIIGQILISKTKIEPSSSKQLEKSWQGEILPGNYKAEANLIYGKGKIISAGTHFNIEG